MESIPLQCPEVATAMCVSVPAASQTCALEKGSKTAEQLQRTRLSLYAIYVEPAALELISSPTVHVQAMCSSASKRTPRSERLAQAVSCSCRQCLFTWRTVITEMRNIYVFAVCQKMCSIALLVSWEFHLCIRAYRCLTAKMEA